MSAWVPAASSWCGTRYWAWARPTRSRDLHRSRRILWCRFISPSADLRTSPGSSNEDLRELRADFQHLRRWRKSVEQAQSYTFKAVITIIVAGFVGAVWLGVKAMLGK